MRMAAPIYDKVCICTCLHHIIPTHWTYVSLRRSLGLYFRQQRPGVGIGFGLGKIGRIMRPGKGKGWPMSYGSGRQRGDSMRGYRHVCGVIRFGWFASSPSGFGCSPGRIIGAERQEFLFVRTFACFTPYRGCFPRKSQVLNSDRFHGLSRS